MNARAVIERVIDGDTIWVRVRIRMRTSAPELRSVGGGTAKAKLEQRFKRGDRVQIHIDTVDAYGRIVGGLSADTYTDGIHGIG